MTERRAGGLRVVRGEPGPESARRPRKRKPLTEEQRVELEQRIEMGEALVDALDLVEAAFSAPGARLAVEPVHRVAGRLGDDVEHLRRVLALLAVEAVWVMPPVGEVPRAAGAMFARQVQLRVWCAERRRRTVEALRVGRRRLRGDQ